MATSFGYGLLLECLLSRHIERVIKHMVLHTPDFLNDISFSAIHETRVRLLHYQ